MNKEAVQIIILLCIIVGLMAFGVEPELRFWLTDEEQKFAYCSDKHPEFNVTGTRGAMCFNEYWNIYSGRYCAEYNCTYVEREIAK